MISLDVLDEGRGGNHRVLGAGFAAAKYDIDEDEGQEDGLDDESECQYIRMSRIRRYFTRYWEANRYVIFWRCMACIDVKSPFYVETDHAIYELDVLKPSKRYRNLFRPFWKLQTTLRFVISSAANNPRQEYPAFLREYCRTRILGQPLTERELWDAVGLFHLGELRLFTLLGPEADPDARNCPKWR